MNLDDFSDDVVRNLGYAWLQLGGLAALEGILVVWLAWLLESPRKKRRRVREDKGDKPGVKGRE